MIAIQIKNLSQIMHIQNLRYYLHKDIGENQIFALSQTGPQINVRT